MEYTQKALGSYLGVWKYEKGKTAKWYRILPVDDKFEIRWGRTLAELALEKTPNRIVISDSEECYKRILSKARGGYIIKEQIRLVDYTPKCWDTFDSMSEVLVAEASESRKRKPRIRKLSLLEWVGGMEEYRENEKS